VYSGEVHAFDVFASNALVAVDLYLSGELAAIDLAASNSVMASNLIASNDIVGSNAIVTSNVYSGEIHAFDVFASNAVSSVDGHFSGIINAQDVSVSNAVMTSNVIASTKVSAPLLNLTDGGDVDGIAGVVGDLRLYGTGLYLCTVAGGAGDATWSALAFVGGNAPTDTDYQVVVSKSGVMYTSNVLVDVE
jgi:hypothetical protein